MYDPMTMICKGFLYFIQGDYDNSEIYFSNIADNDKYNTLNKSIIILAKLGKALNSYNKMNYSKAIDCFVTLIRDYDYINESVLESLGICYYNLGKLKKSKEIFQKVIELNPNNIKVLTYLASIDLVDLEHDTDSITRAYEKIKVAYLQEENSDFHFLLINFANILLMGGKIDQAEELCGKLNHLLEHGEMKLLKKQQKDKYRKDLEEIKSAVFSINAKIHHLKKNYNEAFSWYNKAIQINSKNLDAQFGLGQIYLYMQNLNEAEKCFEACRIDQETSNSFEINKYLAYIYARTKKKETDKTIEMFKKALEVKKDDIDCFIELAQLLEFKKPQESLKLYEQVLGVLHGNKDIIRNTLYNVDDILPEVLNNISTIKIRLNLFDDVEKLLGDALNLIKKQKEVVKMQLENKEKVSGDKVKYYIYIRLIV